MPQDRKTIDEVLRGRIWLLLIRFALVACPAVCGLLLTWGSWVTMSVIQNSTSSQQTVTRAEAAETKTDLLVKIEQIKNESPGLNRLEKQLGEMDRQLGRLQAAVDQQLIKIKQIENRLGMVGGNGGGP